MSERLVKFINETTIQDAVWTKPVFDMTTKQWVKVDKTRDEVLAEGYKPLLDGNTTNEGDYQTIQYRDTSEAVYRDVVAQWYTPEDEAAIQEGFDMLILPRNLVLESLIIASVSRPDITGGALITKDVLRQQIMSKPIDPTFDEVARQMSLIALEDMQPWRRGDTFVDGVLTDIGFAKASINKFFQTGQVGDLMEGWIKPEVV